MENVILLRPYGNLNPKQIEGVEEIVRFSQFLEGIFEHERGRYLIENLPGAYVAQLYKMSIELKPISAHLIRKI